MEDVETREPQTPELSVSSISDSSSLNFLGYFAEMPGYFQWKQTKEKLKCLNSFMTEAVIT